MPCAALGTFPTIMVEPEASAPSALDTLSERVRKSFAVISTGTLSSVSEQKPTENPTEKPASWAR